VRPHNSHFPWDWILGMTRSPETTNSLPAATEGWDSPLRPAGILPGFGAGRDSGGAKGVDQVSNLPSGGILTFE